MLQHPANNLTRFTSVLLYPRGNTHFAEVTSEYQDLLRPAFKTRFVGVTYESFIALLRAQGPPRKASRWLDYLERRYVVPC
jgi:hypothetical protein